jgi:transcriptional regulator with XRE-family HTH domain
MGLPTVSQAVIAYAVEYIEKCHSNGEPYADIARRLGVTPPHISNLRNGRGAGLKLENGLADVVFGGSVDKLRRAAAEWWETEGRMRSHVRKKERGEDPLPNRAYVLDVFGSEFHPETIERVRNDPREVDMPRLSWVKYISFIDDEVRREAAEKEAQRARRTPRLVKSGG